ncbi:UDP-N-acetylmuramoyl-L-alanine--D-glutamate ligase [Oxalobacteraceae bacterium CAVE-383]|nr:UDP-N-acetylmuramoyl-L-alanine--D-glutamate ligase [Oxalobacteraceae bacterium CAVE-383]
MKEALIHIERYAGRTALVLGLGESGLAMALWLDACGVRVRVADTRGEAALAERLAQLREHAPDAEFVSGELNAALLDIDNRDSEGIGSGRVDFIAVSPGLAPQAELREIAAAAAAAEPAIPLWSEIELFAQALAALREQREYAPKVLAITGTNGKTTVTSLTALLCRRAGLSTIMAGNISPAALDTLRQALRDDALPQAWVLELSSFQLHATYSLRADAAAVLNITQDHLDWHGDMASYAAAKQRIFGPDTIRVLNREDPLVMAMAAGAPAVSTFGSDQPSGLDSFGLINENGMQWLAVTVPLEEPQEKKRVRKDAKSQMHLVEAAVMLNRVMPADALKIRGLHNAVNALAALALCRALDLPLAPLLHGLRDYTGEPHRVELVSTISGVEYYDDSKGTNVGATVAALNGLGHGGRPNRLLLIAGGEGKGQDFKPLAEPVSKYARAVLLIGRDAGLIRAAVAAEAEAAAVELIDCPTLEAAVEQAAVLAGPGDAVLLSPACASFDMFRNYAHRAEVFVEAVREAALSRGEVMP